jgi:hypothetical protein
MYQRVTCDDERYQVCFRIVAAMAAKFLVVHLRVGPSATALASQFVSLPVYR